MTSFNKSLYYIPKDTPVVQLICKSAFDNLSEVEKKYATMIAGASWKAALICLFQTSPESPLIFSLLRLAFDFMSSEADKKLQQLQDTCEVSKEAFERAMAYISGFFANLGNYKSFGDTKIIPECSSLEFERIIMKAAEMSDYMAACVGLWDSVKEAVYSLEPQRLRSLGFGPTEGISTYYSSNCTKQDAGFCQRFLDTNGISAYNTRLFKVEGDADTPTKYIVSVAAAVASSDEPVLFEGCEFIVAKGDHKAFMEKAVALLREGTKYAANETQKRMLNLYAECFESGDLNKHIEGSREWIKDKGPVVESYIGFIESYQDPMGTRGEWEGFVAVVNKEMSAKFQSLVDSAESFLPKLPWPSSFEKDVFQRPDFTSLEVLGFGSSGIPAGINIPNYNSVRQVDGFKNVSLGNVLAPAYKPKAGEPVTFIQDCDVKLYQDLVTEAFEVQVGLHELLGHGSGKMFMGEDSAKGAINPLTNSAVSSWYGEGETYDSKFPIISSSYEECRAELVGMYLCPNKDVLSIFGHVGNKADDICYINWLHMARAGILALLFWSPETKRWGQAHMQARFAILRCMLEAGEGFVTVQKNENGETFLSMDRSKIDSVGVTAIGNFLQRVQVFKATADFDAAKAMYDNYTTVDENFQELRAEVIARRKPRKFFVQPNLMMSEASGTVKLEEYEPSAKGVIESFVRRYLTSEVEDVIQQADSEEKYHKY